MAEFEQTEPYVTEKDLLYYDLIHVIKTFDYFCSKPSPSTLSFDKDSLKSAIEDSSTSSIEDSLDSPKNICQDNHVSEEKIKHELLKFYKKLKTDKKQIFLSEDFEYKDFKKLKSDDKKDILFGLYDKNKSRIEHILLITEGKNKLRLLQQYPGFKTIYDDTLNRCQRLIETSKIGGKRQRPTKHKKSRDQKKTHSRKKRKVSNPRPITPLNIINRTPFGCPIQCLRATLPINQLYQAPIKDGSASKACNLAAPSGLLRRPDSNVHRCII